LQIVLHYCIPHLNKDIIVIGTSAGGVEALKELVSHLPADLPASVFIVLHIPPQSTSQLPVILESRGKLPVTHAKHDELIEQAHVYVAPPDHHLLLRSGGRITLSRGPRENRTRPAIDPLFRTAARNYKERVISVILTGTLNDGVAGMLAVKSQGGVAIAQDPNEAIYPEMPQTAIDTKMVDHILSIKDIVTTLDRLVREPIQTNMSHPEEEEKAIQEVDQTLKEQMNGKRNGKTATYSCPECGGVLWEHDIDDLIHFRCHVGHAYTADTLMAEQTEGVETALWSALRALREKAVLSHQIASNMRARGSTYSAQRFEEQAAELEQQITVLHGLLLGNPNQSGARDLYAPDRGNVISDQLPNATKPN
jgi:two-component system, chemotaxis family, protein-glutamate methylesterase/glutaminase